ncbi:hypothetical protein [Kocuria dechangensis]|nr:hypothetical protein [Kocuria dechangensis]
MSKTDIIAVLLAEVDDEGKPVITFSKACKLAVRIMRGDTPAEITNRPDAFRHITYRDDTGEQAVRNVLEEQHQRKAA